MEKSQGEELMAKNDNEDDVDNISSRTYNLTVVITESVHKCKQVKTFSLCVCVRSDVERIVAKRIQLH